jgi:hypothetical protein
MSSPFILYWIPRSILVELSFVIAESPSLGIGLSFPKLGLGKGLSFQIQKVGGEMHHFHAVVQGTKGVLNKSKLSGKASVAVVIAAIMLNFGDDSPVTKVMGGFVEGMECGCGAPEEVEEPTRHGFSDIFVKTVGGRGRDQWCRVPYHGSCQ